MLIKKTTTSYKETQKLGQNVAKNILKLPPQKKAIVLCLKGNLGAGKTTFLQGFAKGLSIKARVLSPTFAILKKFKIQSSNIKSTSKSKVQKFNNFYHLDCYRLNKPKEIIDLGFKEIIKNPGNIVAIEWPEKIKKILPKQNILINFKFIDKNKREIKL